MSNHPTTNTNHNGIDALNTLIEYWRNPDYVPGTFIARRDYQFLSSIGALVDAAEFEYVCQRYGPLNPTVATRLHKELPPEPFHGDIKNASVYMISLNPGCGTYDDEYSPTFGWRWPTLMNIAENNLKQNGKNEYPFYYLDPTLGHTGGGMYWYTGNPKSMASTKKLQSLVSHMAQSPHDTERVRKILAEQLCGLELCPYHSVRWDSFGRRLYRIPSVLAMVDFIAEYVIPDVLAGKKSLVVLRHVRELEKLMSDRRFHHNGHTYSFADLATLDNVCFYTTLAQAAPVTPSRPAGMVIMNQIRDLI